MFYQVNIHAGKPGFFTEVRSHGKIQYITVREMKKLYPDENFVIIGQIGSLSHEPTVGDWLCTEDGKIIPILPRGSLKKPFEWVVGYTEVQDKKYVAVVGGFFHMFMLILCNIRRILGIKRE